MSGALYSFGGLAGAMWFFRHEREDVTMLSLFDASTYARPVAATTVARACRSCLKDDNLLLLAPLASYLFAAIRSTPGLQDVALWSYYPAAQSHNRETELGNVFASLPRTYYGCQDRGPLLLRTHPTAARHLAWGDRDQLLPELRTLRVNAAYEVAGKTVAVIDDYLTYGVSAASAIARLQIAGAAHVTFLSLGKFGDVTKRYDLPGMKPTAGLHSRRSVCAPLDGSYDPDAHLRFSRTLARYL